MATIHRRGGHWRVQVRRRGLSPLSKTFDKHEDATHWAQTVEGRLAAGDVLDLGEARRTTLGEALERYLVEVTPLKKGAKQERVRIRAWLRDPLAARMLASIKPMEIAAWRNERVAAGKAPTTVRNALTIISQIFQVAGTEWGMQGLQNPLRGVRMPRSRPARDRRLEPGEEGGILAGCDAAGQPVLRPRRHLGDRDREAAGRDSCARRAEHPRQRRILTRHQDHPRPVGAAFDSRAQGFGRATRCRCAALSFRSRRTALSISGARRCASPG
jgi:hypothetical protein